MNWLAAILLAAGGGYLLNNVLNKAVVKPGETRLLLIGDSLALGLSPFLQRYAQANNIAFASLARESSKSTDWANPASGLGAELQKYLDGKPTLTLVSLNANDEVANLDAQLAAATAVKDRLRAAGSDVLWIEAPSWPKMNSGYRAALKTMAPHWFASSGLEIPRSGGAGELHPNQNGYGQWAGQIWGSLQ